MADIKAMKELALQAVTGKVAANFTVEDAHESLRQAMLELCGSVNQFMKNRYDIYEIILETADEVVPKSVISAIQMFAETKQVPEGAKLMFTNKTLGKSRAKKFVTRAGLAGVYEAFRLDTSEFEVYTQNIGAAAAIDFDRMLTGAENMGDFMDIITEGTTEAILGEIQKALRAAISVAGRPANNFASENTFIAASMVKIINTVKAYGDNVIILAPPEFIAAMGPDAIVPAMVNTTANLGIAQGIYSPDDIDSIHKTGLIKIFRGTPVVELPQSFTDERNITTQIDPQMAYVLPAGKEKVVVVGFEGNQQIWDFNNADNSMEIHTYRKVGVGIRTYHNWGQYQNTGIPQTYAGE